MSGQKRVDPTIVSLDEVDDSDDNEFSEIPAWEFHDHHSRTTLKIEFDGGEASLVITAGEPDYGPYQRIQLEIPDEAIIRLARAHIMPMATYVEAEEARQHETMAQDEARRRTNADARPWIAQTGTNSARATQVKLHRSECSVVTRSGAIQRGEVTFGGTHNGEELTEVLRIVENSLRELISPRMVGAKKHALSLRDAGRVRHTNLDRRPLTLCLRCNPLGDDTPTLMSEVERLTSTTVVDSEQEMSVVILMDEMRRLVWEEEQKHLDRYLRGTTP